MPTLLPHSQEGILYEVLVGALAYWVSLGPLPAWPHKLRHRSWDYPEQAGCHGLDYLDFHVQTHLLKSQLLQLSRQDRTAHQWPPEWAHWDHYWGIRESEVHSSEGGWLWVGGQQLWQDCCFLLHQVPNNRDIHQEPRRRKHNQQKDETVTWNTCSVNWVWECPYKERRWLDSKITDQLLELPHWSSTITGQR